MRPRVAKRDKPRVYDKLLPTLKAAKKGMPRVSHKLPLDTIYLYHQIWRTLLRGDHDPGHRRRPLPPELVHHISRLADLRVPDNACNFVHTGGIPVRSGGPEFQTKLWFCTSPFDDDFLARVAAVQLFTTSNDQGWATFPDRGSWTWFEWGVFANAAEAAAQATAESETGGWKASHRNRIAEARAQEVSSAVVSINDDMWRRITEGSVIAVRACAVQTGWSNHAHRAEVRFWKWFEPAI